MINADEHYLSEILNCKPQVNNFPAQFIEAVATLVDTDNLNELLIQIQNLINDHQILPNP